MKKSMNPTKLCDWRGRRRCKEEKSSETKILYGLDPRCDFVVVFVLACLVQYCPTSRLSLEPAVGL